MNPIQQALELQKRGDFSQAEQLYQQILQQHPHLDQIWYLLGALYCQTGRYEPALQSIQQALTCNPNNASAYTLLGIIFFTQAQLEACEQAFAEAIKLDPKNIETRYHLAKCLLEQLRIAEAQKCLLDVLSQQPEHADAKALLEKANKMLVEYKDAMMDCADDCVEKDIIIVVHNALKYTKMCLDSVFSHTKNFQLYLWDNASDAQTHDYLKSIAEKNAAVHLTHSKDNIGFILPNNRLAKLGASPYIILLNSDTQVRQHWDYFLLHPLIHNHNIAACSYQGGLLDARAHGCDIGYGIDIDYACGWCLGFSRARYQQIGLFDEQHLQFAYGEDADFSLRLKAKGYDVYASRLMQVRHFENKTIDSVSSHRNLSHYFKRNHDFLQTRWHDYLAHHRILQNSQSIT